MHWQTLSCSPPRCFRLWCWFPHEDEKFPAQFLKTGGKVFVPQRDKGCGVCGQPHTGLVAITALCNSHSSKITGLLCMQQHLVHQGFVCKEELCLCRIWEAKGRDAGTRDKGTRGDVPGVSGERGMGATDNFHFMGPAGLPPFWHTQLEFLWISLILIHPRVKG